MLAPRALNEKLVRPASHSLDASVADIQAADGQVFVVGRDRSLTLREIAKAVYSEIGRLPKDAREEMEVTKVYDPYFGTTTSTTRARNFGTHDIEAARHQVIERLPIGRMGGPDDIAKGIVFLARMISFEAANPRHAQAFLRLSWVRLSCAGRAWWSASWQRPLASVFARRRAAAAMQLGVDRPRSPCAWAWSVHLALR